MVTAILVTQSWNITLTFTHMLPFRPNINKVHPLRSKGRVTLDRNFLLWLVEVSHTLGRTSLNYMYQAMPRLCSPYWVCNFQYDRRQQGYVRPGDHWIDDQVRVVKEPQVIWRSEDVLAGKSSPPFLFIGCSSHWLSEWESIAWRSGRFGSRKRGETTGNYS